MHRLCYLSFVMSIINSYYSLGSNEPQEIILYKDNNFNVLTI